METRQVTYGRVQGRSQQAGRARRRPSAFGSDGRSVQHEARRGADERLAKALGWFSIGLGLAQVLVPRSLARFIGVRAGADNEALLRGLGMREIATGLGILSRPAAAGWIWARVAGDVMDLALLGRAYRSAHNGQGRVAGAIAAVAGVTLLDLYDALRLSRQSGAGRDAGKHAFHVRKSITIKAAPEEVYRFWRDFQNLPRFMSHLESVTVTGAGRSHWRTKGPAGRSVEWDAVLVDDRPNELIAWRSVGGADVENAGVVRFEAAPGGRGTEVHVDLRYDAPGGRAGKLLAGLFGEAPGQQVQDDLRAFKQVMETGEVVRSDGSRRGRFPQHPARPAEAGVER